MSNVILIVADNPDNYNLTVDNSGESVDCTYTDAVIPSNHAITHRYNGSDPLTIGDIVPLPNNANLFLNGTGGFSTPAGGGGGSNQTNLSVSYSSSGFIIESDTGTDAIVNSATISFAGAFSSTDKIKLNSIQSGAEININADWNSTSGDSLILNKPTLGSAASSNTGDFAPNTHASRHVTGGSDKIRDASASQDGLMTSTYAFKLDGIQSGAEVNINADWNAITGDAAILNKPSLGSAAYLNTGITSNTVALGNDPRFTDSRTPNTHGSSHISGGSDSIRLATASQDGLMSPFYASKLDGIQAGAEVNVNADWNTTTGDAAILNKPSLGSAAALNTGNSSNTVAVGNDPRFTDNRAPLSHAPSHVSGGSDSIRLATASQDGLMSPAYASKLDGIAVSANNYVLPVATTGTIGGVKRNVGLIGQFVESIDSSGNLIYGTPSGAGSSGVSSVNLNSSYSPTGIVINNSAGSGVSLDLATNSNAGLMSSSDRLKFTSIESGAQKNINANWNATTGNSVILNKPDITLYTVGLFLN